MEIIGEDECRRPENSPPSYEDAMKYVNEAFESSGTEVSTRDLIQSSFVNISQNPNKGDDVKSVNLADIEKVRHALLIGLGE